MSGPTQHLPFFSSAETACLEQVCGLRCRNAKRALGIDEWIAAGLAQVHEGFTNHFATVHEFFIHTCDDHK